MILVQKSDRAGETTKNLNMSSPDGTAVGAMLRVSQKSGDQLRPIQFL